MIVVLYDQLFHLALCVGISFCHMHRNIWDLRPYDHTVSITQVVEFLRVLIMCQTDRVRSDLFDELHILLMHGHIQCISCARAVLMPAHTVKRIRPAV